MCYSAMVKQRYAEYVRQCGATIDLDTFAKLYLFRSQGGNVRWARDMDSNFAEPGNAAAQQIQDLIQTHNRQCAEQWEQELFKQRRRLADAERALQARPTK